VAAGENPCQYSELQCPVLDQCTLNNSCVEGQGCVPILKTCALNNTDANATDFCNLQSCDPAAGCISQPRICPNSDIGCYDAKCDNVSRSCTQTQKSNFNKNTGKGGILCTLLYNKAAKVAAISAGVTAGIVIGAVAAAAVIGVGGKAGYDYLVAKNSAVGAVQDNPLYTQAAGAGNNQLYEGGG